MKIHWQKLVHNFKNIGFVILGILIVYFGISLALDFMKGSFGIEEVVLNTLELRSSQKGLVEKSRLITQTNEIIEAMHNNAVESAWANLSGCLSAKCDDPQYFAFIEAVAKETSLKDKNLIFNVIGLRQNWGRGDLIKFSKAITSIDQELKTAPQELYKKWQEIIACDGKCSDMNNLFFDMIGITLKKNSIPPSQPE